MCFSGCFWQVERVQSIDLFGMYLWLLQDYIIQMAQRVFNVLQYIASYFGTVKTMGDMANNDVFCGGVDNACDLQQTIEYQKKQLAFAKDVGDKAGEARACGYLSDAFDSVGDFQQALEYGKKHLSIAKEVGDLSIPKKDKLMAIWAMPINHFLISNEQQSVTQGLSPLLKRRKTRSQKVVPIAI